MAEEQGDREWGHRGAERDDLLPAAPYGDPQLSHRFHFSF